MRSGTLKYRIEQTKALKNMENEFENNDSPNVELDGQDEPETTPEEELEGDSEEMIALKQKNRQLFERAKKAEGFDKQEDGSWIKKPKPEPKKPEVKPLPQKEVTPDAKSIVSEMFEQRDLEALDVSEVLQREIQTYAKLNGVSIKKAFESEYIQFKKGKEDQASKLNDASLPKGRKGTASKDYSQMKATDFDLTTPEGRQGFKEYKEWLKS